MNNQERKQLLAEGRISELLDHSIRWLSMEQPRTVLAMRPDYMVHNFLGYVLAIEPEWLVKNYPFAVLLERPQFMAETQPKWCWANSRITLLQHNKDWLRNMQPAWLCENSWGEVSREWLLTKRPDLCLQRHREWALAQGLKDE